MNYDIIRNQPLAKFRYKGTHRNAVRRTVVLTGITKNVLTGYEVREGNETRSLEDNVIKSFSRTDVEDLQRFSLANETW